MFIKKKGGDWEDAYNVYGLSLSETGLSRLMTPAPNKSAVTNKNVISHGASVVQDTFYKDVRQVSLYTALHKVSAQRRLPFPLR